MDEMEADKNEVAREMCGLLSVTIPLEQMVVVIEKLLVGLTDADADSASGTAAIINGLIEQQVSPILILMLE